MSKNVKLTPEQAGVLACIRCIDQMLEALEVGIANHDWGTFRQSWITKSDEQVQAIFEKAEQDNEKGERSDRID